MAATASPRSGDGWEPTLAAALLGADRAPHLPPDALSGPPSGEDAGGALLVRLAAHGLYHLAGTGRAAETLHPLPEREASGPVCPPAAADRLALLLAADAPKVRLREWCELAADAGLRAPPWLVPALAPLRREWPETIARIAGAELDWLAAPGSETPEDAAQDWTERTPAERRAAFAAFRRRDPAAARAALEAGFRGEKADMRQALVSALDDGLGEADEPFLEACLDDRASGVRGAAQNLLPRLPGSRLAQRMAERVRAALAIETKKGLLGGLIGGTKHGLVVTLPEEAPDLTRDGIEVSEYQRRGGGLRANLLQQIVAGAPLHAFAGHPPRLWIELALRSEWSEPIVQGLFRAVRRGRDPAWVRDLAAVLGEAASGRLAGVKVTNPLAKMWADAVRLLPQDEWEALATEALRAKRLEPVLALLETGRPAYSARFTGALLDFLALVTRGTPSLRAELAKPWTLGRLGEHLHPSAAAAAAAAAILARLPEDSEERLRNQLTTLASTLDLRAAMRREFA